MQNLAVRLIQTHLHWQDADANRSHLGELVSRIGGEADLIVLPETFTTGFAADRVNEGMDGPTIPWMQSLAAEQDAAIVGSVAIVEDGHRFNRALFVDRDGLQARYDKRHLFSFGGESDVYTAGTERVVAHWRGWRICLQVCYDLRFPVWSRYRDDYDCLLYVANWPSRRVGVWSTLLEARAIENQCYVIGANRIGEDGKGVAYCGHSVIHDPLGRLLNEPGDGEAVIDATLDAGRLAEVRTSFPFLNDADAFELVERP